MKLASLAVAGLVFGAGLLNPSKKPETITLVIAGDIHGYLAPCGCTKPMVGGIKRWATVVKSLAQQGKSIVLVNGGLSGGGLGRQQELKVEALSESFRALNVTALNLTLGDAQFGIGLQTTIKNFAGNSLVSGSIDPQNALQIPPSVESGPFLIAGVSEKPELLGAAVGEKFVPSDQAIQEFVDDANTRGLRPVLMWSGDEASATSIAKSHPEIVAIVFSSSNVLQARAKVVGTTWLVTPGEKGRALVSIQWDGEKFDSYRNIPLGPEFDEEPEVSRVYSRYLSRVNDEQLLMKSPRTSDAEFAGSESCSKCHEEESKIWHKTEHSHALKTLEDVGHDRDPDCVSCHVVGLESTKGFMSRPETPKLADVGCESCHGPAANHVLNPKMNNLGKAGKEACMKCHIPEHSPKFEFESFWEKIKH